MFAGKGFTGKCSCRRLGFCSGKTTPALLGHQMKQERVPRETSGMAAFWYKPAITHRKQRRSPDPRMLLLLTRPPLLENLLESLRMFQTKTILAIEAPRAVSRLWDVAARPEYGWNRTWQVSATFRNRCVQQRTPTRIRLLSLQRSPTTVPLDTLLPNSIANSFVPFSPPRQSSTELTNI